MEAYYPILRARFGEYVLQLAKHAHYEFSFHISMVDCISIYS